MLFKKEALERLLLVGFRNLIKNESDTFMGVCGFDSIRCRDYGELAAKLNGKTFNLFGASSRMAA